jgi:hypothetical protein
MQPARYAILAANEVLSAVADPDYVTGQEP